MHQFQLALDSFLEEIFPDQLDNHTLPGSRWLKVRDDGAIFVVDFHKFGKLREFYFPEPTKTWNGTWEKRGKILAVTVGDFTLKVKPQRGENGGYIGEEGETKYSLIPIAS